MQNIPLIDPPMQSMTLADGRQMTWQEFGASDGRPTLYFHGGGSYSLEAGLFHREAIQRNLRLIATNRPGAGGSSLCPGRQVAAYSDDLRELLDRLRIDKVACLGESNGGMVTMAVAGTMPTRVIGAVPINPTLPWFDPWARRVSPRGSGLGYGLIKHVPRLVAFMVSRDASKAAGPIPKAGQPGATPSRRDLTGPPPGTEADIAQLFHQVVLQRDYPRVKAELQWATSDWGFNHYTIPVPLDFFCGVYDTQAPFALVLADRNPNARFQSFSFGHLGFMHPDARRAILDRISSYFGS